MDNILEFLLTPEVPNVLRDLPEKQFEVKRLSRLMGQKAVFTLRALPYGKVQDIRQMPEADQEAQILLQGCVSPDLKSQALMEKYSVATPLDAIRSLLLPGEIADLSMEVERLSGYRRKTIDEIKNG